MRKHLKDYFIPHDGNDYKPRSLRKTAMVGMMAMVLLSFVLLNTQSFLLLSSSWMMSAVLPSVIVDMVNEERIDGELIQLKRSAVLDAAAQLKAEDMATYEYFAHFSPSGVSPWSFFNRAGYNFANAGENLAIHFTDTGKLVDAWIASPTHRANIMNGVYTETGIGIAEGEFEGFKTLYVVQFFGTPAAQAVSTPLATTSMVTTQSQEVQRVDDFAASVSEEIPEQTELTLVNTNTQAVLAETAQITEYIEIVEDDPVVVTNKVLNASIDNDENIALADTTTTTRESMYLEFMATTSGAVPASIDSSGLANVNESPYLFEVLTQPTFILKVAYTAIGLLVLVSLLLSIFIEIKRQHPMQIAYSLALLLLMFGLFKIQMVINSGGIII